MSDVVYVAVGRGGRHARMVYHLVRGCFERNGVSRRVATLLSEAEAAGLEPCQFCGGG